MPYCKGCEKRARLHAQKQALKIEKAQKKYDQFLERKPVFEITGHVSQRMVDRVISTQELVTALHEGLVIEVQQEEIYLVYSNVKTKVNGKIYYRPIHVALGVEKIETNMVKVITVMPVDEENRRHWDETFTQRVCWCK